MPTGNAGPVRKNGRTSAQPNRQLEDPPFPRLGSSLERTLERLLLDETRKKDKISASWFTFLAAAPYLLTERLHQPPSTYGLMILLPMAGYMFGNAGVYDYRCSSEAHSCLSSGSRCPCLGHYARGLVSDRFDAMGAVRADGDQLDRQWHERAIRRRRSTSVYREYRRLPRGSWALRR